MKKFTQLMALTATLGLCMTSLKSTAQTTPFISTWEVTSSPLQLPTNGSYAVHWDNGSQSGDTSVSNISGYMDLRLPSTGSYTLTITPTNSTNFCFKAVSQGAASQLKEVKQWGNTPWASWENAFYSCTNLKVTATDIPNLNGVTSLAGAFNNCISLTTVPNMNSWDLSKISNLERMFYNDVLFNQDISNWNTSDVTNMSNMLSNAQAFNQPIGKWDVSNVDDMGYFLRNGKAFNQNLGSWTFKQGAYLAGLLDFLPNHEMSCQNYDATLAGWASNDKQPDNLFIGVNNLFFGQEAEANRNSLISKKSWTLAGDKLTDGCPLTPLLITLTDFTVTKSRLSAVLNWVSELEDNAKGYSIQRSANGYDFSESIGFVTATGAGAYAFTDLSPLQGINYYRLALTNLDGTVSFSQVKTMNFDQKASISVYPNPVQGGRLQIKATVDCAANVYSLAGNLILTLQLKAGINQVNVSNLHKGLYILKTTNDESFKFLKN